MSPQKKVFTALFAAMAVVAAVPCALVLKAKLAGNDDVPVIFYPEIGNGSNAVRADLFYEQMRDLADGAFNPVAPERLFQRKRWGRPLPERPVLIFIGNVAPEAAVAVGEALSEYDFPAITGKDFATASGIGLSGRSGIAKIGGGAGADDLSALPAIPVATGDMSFSVRLFRDSTDPDFFGSLRIAQPTGVRIPVSVIAYRPRDNAPWVQTDAPLLPSGDDDGTLDIPLAADIEFPLEVAIYDQNRIVLYHTVSVAKSAAIKPRGWRQPVSDPSREIKIEEF